MRSVGRLALCALALGAASVAALAQSVIAAHSGLIHYVEGQAYLGDTPLANKFGDFPVVKENATLRTADGRAEVLLTPGTFLRLAENSSFRMVTNRLVDTRLELLTGSAIVEAEEVPKDNSVTVVYRDAAVHVEKKGLYRFDTQSGQLRVFDGLARVTAADHSVQVKEGHQVALDTLAVTRFDKEASDALNRWSARRSEYLAMASAAPANSLRNSDAWMSSGTAASGWYWNQNFGMYSFVPGLDGSWFSPYGYRFWSPWDVGYAPQYYSYYAPGYLGGYNPGSVASIPVASTGGVHAPPPGGIGTRYSPAGEPGGFSHGFPGSSHESSGHAGVASSGHASK